MINKSILLLFILCNNHLLAQETQVESNSRLYLEIFVNGVMDYNRESFESTDLESTLGSGWGFGLQTTIFLNNNWGLVFRASNDIYSITHSLDDDSLEKDLSKAHQQSIYQGLVYRDRITPSKHYYEGVIGFGWTRYGVPRIEFESGYRYELNDVSGFSAYLGFGYEFQYSNNSSIKLYASSIVECLGYEFRSGSLGDWNNEAYSGLRISIGHVSRLLPNNRPN